MPSTDTPETPAFPLLGLDVSDRRIGVAIAESADAPSSPLFTLQRTSRARDLGRCVEWVQRYDIRGVVIGLPLNMDGSTGPRAEAVTRFAEELRTRIAVPVWLHDERLSTVEADELLAAQGMSAAERKERLDAVAAALILQRFLHESQERL